MKNQISIIGVGMVGGTLFQYFTSKPFITCDYKIIPYDIKKYPELKQEALNADIIFICVPTPYNEKGHDLSIVKEVVASIPDEKIIVIKSTILPGTIDILQLQYPQHKFLFNPEFLTEANAWNDFINPERQIIGYTEKSQDIAPDILELLPQAPYENIMPASEAELVKYFGNAFLATKVIFANFIYDIAEKLGLNYNNIKEAVSHDSRIGASHLDVIQDGYRGYAGTCFPKDVRSLIQLGHELDVNPILLEIVDVVNKQLIDQSKHEE